MTSTYVSFRLRADERSSPDVPVTVRLGQRWSAGKW
jgi:hypothetical protein